jgi:hypothetical protein
LLDFHRHRSVTVPHQNGGQYGSQYHRTSDQEHHQRNPRKADRAARIATAAEACALAGSIAEGVTVSMEIERLVYEAERLQDGASLLNRLSQE